MIDMTAQERASKLIDKHLDYNMIRIDAAGWD